jgi:hypothetical protein
MVLASPVGAWPRIVAARSAADPVRPPDEALGLLLELLLLLPQPTANATIATIATRSTAARV